MAIDFQKINYQIGVAKQELEHHRARRESPIPANDPIVHIHDAVRALQVALGDLTAQLGDAEANKPTQSLANQIRDDI